MPWDLGSKNNSRLSSVVSWAASRSSTFLFVVLKILAILHLISNAMPLQAPFGEQINTFHTSYL